MSLRRVFVLSGMILLSGCLYHARERTDKTVCDLASQPYDQEPPAKAQPKADAQPTPGKLPEGEVKRPPLIPPTDLETTRLMESRNTVNSVTAEGMQQVAFAQVAPNPMVEEIKKKFQIPTELPGANAPKIPGRMPVEPAERRREIRSLYTELPPLPEVPQALPGPDGKPYTLAELQQLAAKNSPTLRQAASDVEAARGAMIQAAAYPNPNGGFFITPSNDGSTAGLDGLFLDQTIKTAGKLRLATAAAQKDLDNAELALKRARTDLSTAVRNAYFALLVSEETVRINLALARFTDDVYRLQINITAEGGVGAPYEPAALRAQAFTVRLSLKQSIQNYIYNWKQLVTAIGEQQLPLSQVAGHVDSMIPYYDYDTVLQHVLHRHTDVLTAYNGLDKARALLKLQQVTPIPDVDINVGVLKEFALAPQQVTPTITITMPIPIWDQNKGNILSAESALVRATEEPHRVELNLTNNLANAYNNYKNNLDGLEYYRKYILPDQVRTYEGTYKRYGIDPGVVFGDVVAAQQTLVSGVSTYLTVLGQLWTSVVSVADFLQTDDLFQIAEPRELPLLPDLEHFGPWPCCHDCPAVGCACQPRAVPTAPEIKTAKPQAATVNETAKPQASNVPTANGTGRTIVPVSAVQKPEPLTNLNGPTLGPPQP
jgi:outer membrane protein, heavy metal efflux system